MALTGSSAGDALHGVAGTHERPARATDAAAVLTYARVTAVLLLVTIVAGFFGEVYVPSKVIVPGDAQATIVNVKAFDFLFRLGFASYLVEALCDVALALLFYLLLRPVRRDVALLAAFFGLVSTALFAVAELFFIAPVLLLRDPAYLRPFDPGQVAALALVSLKIYGRAGVVFMAFYGVATLLRGYLIYKSGYLPRFVGVLLGIAGAGFIVKNFTLLLAPRYASDLLLLPMFLAVVSLTAWLLVKGVDLAKWDARVAGRGTVAPE